MILTEQQREAVRKIEEKHDLILMKVSMKNGIRTWEWKAKNGCYLAQLLSNAFGNGKKTKGKK